MEELENLENSIDLEEGSPLESPEPQSEHACKMCEDKLKQPRVLSCLHVFCESCLDKVLEEDSMMPSDLLDDKDDQGDRDGFSTGFINCSVCKQETKVPGKKANSLPLDHVMSGFIEKTGIDNMELICTSCKTKEKAIARCSDCANYLCPNCVTAHQYMRCFENHKVVSFEEMKGSGDGMHFHRPITCSVHEGEALKFFCSTCQIPVCNECLVGEHKLPSHHHDRISDVEEKQKEELKNLVGELKSKLDFCDDTSVSVENLLTDLESQREDAKSHIEETFQSYKACLEKIKESKLEELNEIHKKQELMIMGILESLGRTKDKVEDATGFTERLLEHGNGLEILSIKQLVVTQLLSLINNTPKPELTVSLKFQTDASAFEETVKAAFGQFKRTEAAKEPVQTSPMHSSFESDAAFAALPGVGLNSESDNILPANLNTQSIQEFNIAQLASLMEQNSSHSHDTPLSIADFMAPGTVTDSISTASRIHALNNISALAKLGAVNNHHSMMLNGHSSSLSLDALNFQSPQSPTGNPVHASTNQALRSMQSSPLDPFLHAGRGGSPNSFDAASSLLNGGSPTQLNGSISIASALAGLQLGGQSLSPRGTNVKLLHMQIRCKFGQLGPGKGQFNSPHGFCLGVEEDIIVADTNNHRVQVFEKTGEFKYQFGIPGKEEGQLWYPRKVAIIRTSGKFVVCDRGNERSRMQIFTKNGHFIKKIAIRYIDIVAGLAITPQGHIVAVDSVSPTVFVIHENGDLLRWFDCSDYMREPSDIAVSGKEFFVCDFKGHCVVVFSEDGQFQRRIGCENITNFPNGIDISDAGDVLVGDSHGNRFHVAVFYKDGSLLSEFECPYVKVSRCCGLKITSEGYVVTLAKNNHHVLVLNTLYIA